MRGCPLFTACIELRFPRFLLPVVVHFKTSAAPLFDFRIPYLMQTKVQPIYF